MAVLRSRSGQSPLSPSLSPARFLPYRPRLRRSYSEIFCPLLPHRIPARHSISISIAVVVVVVLVLVLVVVAVAATAATARRSHNKPVDFSPTTPYNPVYSPCVRHVRRSRCVRRVNVRPSPHATDRRASYAPTHRSPVCFGFPGVTRAPHFSGDFGLLSLSLSLPSLSHSLLLFPPFPRPSLFLIRPFRAFVFSPSSSLAAQYIPMSVKPIAAWNDGVVPKWGLTESRRCQ